jgi:outer membrane receptor for ferrienterochelin and colicins
MTNPERSRRAERNRLAIFGRACSIVLAAMLAMSSSVSAQSSLPDLSLEDLMKLDAGQVFGASERLQPVLEAPASVSFVTAEEIARNGYRTLADILRGVRGMYVTNDRNFSYIGMRGFSKPGDYNSRILLLVNGHRVNDNVFGQAEIGAEFGIDPAMFERVEIIRGPSSSLYGDSAFFAVVNVITRTGASLAGGSVTMEAGTLGTHLARGAIGHLFANGVEVALSSTGEHSDGVGRLHFPAFDAINHGMADGLDGEGVKQLYGRVDFSGLTVTGAYGTRERGVPTASFGTLFDAQNPREQTTDRHTLLDAAYGRSFSAARVTFRASFDRFSYDGIYPFTTDGADAPVAIGFNSVVGTRWSVESGLTSSFRGRQTVKAGVQFIDNVHQDQTLRYSDSPSPVFDLRRSSTQQAIYIQDEIKLARWLIVNAGLRYDGYQAFTRVTPRAAFIFMPSSTQSLKYLYGDAFRAPNAYELNTYDFGAQVENLRPESIQTHEFVWERYANDWLRTSVSTYWYKANRLITLVPDASTLLGASYVNLGQVRAKGLEFEAQMRLSGGAQALMSYALQSAVDQETHAVLPNSPRHMAKARLSLRGPAPRSTVSVEGQYLSRRETLAGATVSAATTLNVTMVQPLGQSWELFGGVRNIFDDRYADPVSSGHMQDSISQNGRTARIGLQWRLGKKSLTLP